jgi:uncharacterized membrane protein YfcA
MGNLGEMGLISGLEISLLSFATFVTAALTAVVGAGGGTALIVLMLQIMPPSVAIPVHGVVQLASNISRVWMLWEHLAWPIIIRFALLLPFGVALGLWLFTGLGFDRIQILIGCFVLFTLALRHLKIMKGRELPLWAFVPLGFVTGVLNMVVGVIAPVLGVLVIRKNLAKEQVVGTLGFFGLVGNFFKIVGFTLVGFSFADHWVAIVCMVPAAVLGARTGRNLLGRINEKVFLFAFQITLGVLAIKLIAIDGLGLFAAI